VRTELDEDVLAAPAERADPRAFEPCRERRRKWAPQVRPAQLGPHDPPPAHHPREAAPHRLDFGQFGHRRRAFDRWRRRAGEGAYPSGGPPPPLRASAQAYNSANEASAKFGSRPSAKPRIRARILASTGLGSDAGPESGSGSGEAVGSGRAASSAAAS